tara:strand:- start:164 stop:370 length:207 start_codon:yes stop_codon:yes gene_type:complete
MTDRKNTEGQELSLDQLKDAAGGRMENVFNGMRPEVMGGLTADQLSEFKRDKKPSSNFYDETDPSPDY